MSLMTFQPYIFFLTNPIIFIHCHQLIWGFKVCNCLIKLSFWAQNWLGNHDLWIIFFKIRIIKFSDIISKHYDNAFVSLCFVIFSEKERRSYEIRNSYFVFGSVCLTLRRLYTMTEVLHFLSLGKEISHIVTIMWCKQSQYIFLCFVTKLMQGYWPLKIPSKFLKFLFPS